MKHHLQREYLQMVVASKNSKKEKVSMGRGLLYIMTLSILIGLAACKGGPKDLEPSTQMRKEIVENVRSQVIPFWMDYAPAPDGGFYGTVLRNGTPVVDAHRGGVLNARIVWSFSAAYIMYKDEKYKELANRAQRYFIDTFIDKKNGGVFWLVDEKGDVINSSKYTFAMTYAIYGLAEHYKATGNKESLQTAIELYNTLEEKGREALYDGYLESFTEDWRPMERYDMDAPKTMNAHLHVMEAYTLLYQCWKDEKLKDRLRYCTELFIDKIYDPSRKHFNLYFDNRWNSLAKQDSYGHDIETGWLLCEAARSLEDKSLTEKANRIAVDVTSACLAEGLNEKGYMVSEKKEGKIDGHSSWWGQVETIIGCVNAWQISGDKSYLDSASKVWSFVKDKMIDNEYGEWYSDCYDGEPIVDAPKINMWRCPYHTVRLAVEINNRLK